MFEGLEFRFWGYRAPGSVFRGFGFVYKDSQGKPESLSPKLG